MNRFERNPMSFDNIPATEKAVTFRSRGALHLVYLTGWFVPPLHSGTQPHERERYCSQACNFHIKSPPLPLNPAGFTTPWTPICWPLTLGAPSPSPRPQPPTPIPGAPHLSSPHHHRIPCHDARMPPPQASCASILIPHWHARMSFPEISHRLDVDAEPRG